MNQILFPILLVAGIGLIAGLGLAIASIVMAVPKDEKAEAIQEILPGANCGACGYSGCSGYAAALAKGEAENGLCAPGGQAVAEQVAALLGVEAGQVEQKAAFVHCMGSYDHTADRLQYQGIPSCAAAAQLSGGLGDCSYGCIGLGDCAAACEYHAVKVCNGVASIDPFRCKGCSQCVSACPKGLISLAPVKRQAMVRCSNCDKGGDARKVCTAACIGCMRCVKECEFGAVEVKNFLARVDPEKCTGCGKCVEVCKPGCLTLFSTPAAPPAVGHVAHKAFSKKNLAARAET